MNYSNKIICMGSMFKVFLNKIYTNISVLHSRYIQNKRFKINDIISKKKLIVFIVPYKEAISGGVLSIYSLAIYSRKIMGDYSVIIATEPRYKTHHINRTFTNDEEIYRINQFLKNPIKIDSLILHIPEYLSSKFYKRLGRNQRAFLSKIKDLHINILNQNIELMPPLEKITDLYKLTSNITQTLAFNKNLRQELADRYKMPVHLLSTWFTTLFHDCITPTKYFTKKQSRTICLSPDKSTYKNSIIKLLQERLPNYKIVIINGLTYNEYLYLISNSFLVITFGEGFDGYFSQPPKFGTVSIAVYNEQFFPSNEYLELSNVFRSYDILHQKIVGFIKSLEKSENNYDNICLKTNELIAKDYSEDKYINNLSRFYSNKYDLLPKLK